MKKKNAMSVCSKCSLTFKDDIPNSPLILCNECEGEMKRLYADKRYRGNRITNQSKSETMKNHFLGRNSMDEESLDRVIKILENEN